MVSDMFDKAKEEKIKTITIRKYYLLSCHRYFVFVGHKEYEELLILNVTNDGGDISFTFTDLTTNEIISFDNNSSLVLRTSPRISNLKTSIHELLVIILVLISS